MKKVQVNLTHHQPVSNEIHYLYFFDHASSFRLHVINSGIQLNFYLLFGYYRTFTIDLNLAIPYYYYTYCCLYKVYITALALSD